MNFRKNLRVWWREKCHFCNRFQRTLFEHSLCICRRSPISQMSPSWLKKWSCNLCIKIRLFANFSSRSLSTCSVIASKDVVIGFRYGRRFLLCRSLWEWRIWVKRSKRMGVAIQQYISVSFHSCAKQGTAWLLGRMHKNFSQVLAWIHKGHLQWSSSLGVLYSFLE